MSNRHFSDRVVRLRFNFVTWSADLWAADDGNCPRTEYRLARRTPELNEILVEISIAFMLNKQHERSDMVPHRRYQQLERLLLQ
jgi:hypothetical protein